MTNSGFLSDDHARAISRLSKLETLRDQARDGHRAAMVDAIEKMIQSELRLLNTLRKQDSQDAHEPHDKQARSSERPGG